MDDEEKRLFLQALKAVGIVKLRIGFDGSGDSGQVQDELAVEGLAEGIDLRNVPVPPIEYLDTREIQGRRYDPATGKYEPAYGDKAPNMHAFIVNTAYNLLEDTNIDWVNNDGGYGVIAIVPGHDEIAIEMNQRTSSVETSYFHPGFADPENEIQPGDEMFYEVY